MERLSCKPDPRRIQLGLASAHYCALALFRFALTMFPHFTTAEYLKTVPINYGDVKSAVAALDGRFFVGQHWKFWMEDDPREPDGILRLADYVCYESGCDESKWELVA